MTAPDAKAVEAPVTLTEAIAWIEQLGRDSGQTPQRDACRLLGQAARAYLQSRQQEPVAQAAFNKMFAGTTPADLPSLPRAPMRYDVDGNERPDDGLLVFYEDYAELRAMYDAAQSPTGREG